MIPHNLIISGFLSYRDPVEIDFTGFDLACIAGANGAGKSSILDAITWALFGQARQRGDAIINAQSDTAEVVLVFEYEGNLYRVLRAKPRNKTGILEFHIAQKHQPAPEAAESGPREWKPLTERAGRKTQKRIEETLRLDYETFINAAFFLQGKADQFTQQRPGDRKRILASILGLEIWETYRQRAVQRRKDVESEIRAADIRLSEIAAELSEAPQRQKRLDELTAELERLEQARKSQAQMLENIRRVAASLDEQRKLIAALTRQLETDRERVNELELRLESRQMERKKHAQILARQTEILEAYEALQRARAELARWDESASQFREHEQKRQGPLTRLEAARARLLQEVETLRARESAISEQRADLRDLQSQIENARAKITGLQSEIEKRKTLEAQLAEASEDFANARAENPRLKAEMEELKARIDQLSETEGAACPLCEQPLAPDDRLALIAALEIQGKAMGNKYRANKSLLEQSKSLVNDLKSQIERLKPLDDELLALQNELGQVKAQKEHLEARIDDWEREGEPRLAEVVRALEEETFASETRAELNAIDAELQAIGYDAAAHDAVRRAAADTTAEDDYRALESAQAALEPLDAEIDSIQ
ncbi:MAG TPA: SMC family ATPase, partial [Anaerolineales bacterium]|nr:SMC family ATPase [Anaerolineales bacterium]